MGLISDGTTIFDAGALDSGIAKGAMTFIKKLTASSSGTLTFHNGAYTCERSTMKLTKNEQKYWKWINNLDFFI